MVSALHLPGDASNFCFKKVGGVWTASCHTVTC